MYKVSILFLLSFFNISFGCPRNETNTDSNDKQDKCKYKIYFDKQFLANKDAIVKNKEIEDCYIDVKNGKSDVKGKTKSLNRNFFEFDFVKACGLMRIYESDGKLEFVKVTKDNIETNAIYFFGGYYDDDDNCLNFAIFKDINKAIKLNIRYEIAYPTTFRQNINNLLTK